MRSGDRVCFILAECTGLQVQAMTWAATREDERYVFDYHSMLDHKGKKLTPVPGCRASPEGMPSNRFSISFWNLFSKDA